MKSILLLLVSCLHYTLQSQCLNVHLNTQSQVDSFTSLGCLDIQGDLVINGIDITNIDGLSNIETIYGDLHINSTSIDSINLNQLKSCGDNFIIGNNEALRFVSLNNLKSSKSLIINDNNSLITVETNELEDLEESHQIRNNKLIHCVTMPKLKKVGNIFLVEENTELEILDYPKLDTVSLDIQIVRNQQLNSCKFYSLSYAKEMRVFDNDSLVYFKAPVLNSIDDIFLSGNNSLRHIEFPELGFIHRLHLFETKLYSFSLPSLRETNTINITGNEYLDNFNINSLEKVNNTLNLINNSVLSSLNLQSLKCVQGTRIESCTTLKEVKFDSLESIGNLNVFGNDSIKMLHFPMLQEFGYSINITSNKNLCEIISPNSVKLPVFCNFIDLPRLKNLDFLANARNFENLSIIDIDSTAAINLNRVDSIDWLQINNNKNLKTITMDSLSIINQVQINENDSLYEIQFSYLKSINQFFIVNNNQNLNIIDLNNLQNVKEWYLVSGNPQLVQHNISRLRTVGENIAIQYTMQLDTIRLDSLYHVGSFLSVYNQGTKAILAPKLKTIDNIFAIGGNDSLNQIDFSNLNLVGEFQLVLNPNLTECQTLCPIISTNGIKNEIVIMDNGINCSSQVDILNSCQDYCFSSLTLDTIILNRYNVSNSISISGTPSSDLQINTGFSAQINPQFSLPPTFQLEINISNCGTN